jgi:EmrB/QacA subfamily drug resistance transporter
MSRGAPAATVSGMYSPTVRQLAAPPRRVRPAPPRGAPGWTFAITAAGLFMFALDRLIVVSALPVIRRDLGASLSALEWTVSAFTLTFAVLLLAGAALGDRFGRRRMFVAGLGLFTAGSAAAALAPSAGVLVAARALQGLGGALIMPLSLTLLMAATPPARRGAVLGAWGASAAIAAALGPVLGGFLTDALSWHWIFWVNVPIGLALLPLASRRLAESRGPDRRLDLPGLALSGAGLLALVWALVEHDARALPPALAGLAGFVVWERRSPAPMLPLRFFARRPFAVASATCLLAYFALFGSLFLIGQLLQVGHGATPAQAGLGLLPMSATMAVVAPVAGALSGRIGARRLMAAALGLSAASLVWLAAAAGAAYPVLVPGLAAIGAGAACLFVPIQATLLGAVEPARQGQASGAAVAFRELGGVLGVAVLAAVFSAHGGVTSASAFVDGARPAFLVAAAVAGAAALLALGLRARVAAPLRRAVLAE